MPSGPNNVLRAKSSAGLPVAFVITADNTCEPGLQYANSAPGATAMGMLSAYSIQLLLASIS